MPPHFADRLTAAIAARNTPAVVGLDPLIERLPPLLRASAAAPDSAAAAIEAFCREVIDAVAPLVPAVKINSAFFEAFYEFGVAAYFRVIAHAHARGLLVIGDVKRGDIGSTARLYARGHLDQPAFELDPARVADAVTLAGYLGRGAVQPFIDAGRAPGRGVFVLVRPSDPAADEVHEFAGGAAAAGVPFYRHMAALVHAWGSAPELLGRCGLSCVGAVVAPKDAATTVAVRAALPHAIFLVPGFGAQGATAADCKACFLPGGRGAIVNASRSVIFAYEKTGSAASKGGDWLRDVESACREFITQLRSAIPQ
ncbi:Orotidine 5'-phosphate decarboxylase [Phycisphaerae bacterium RAS1]|nr:Orotidine 5'-phosphate decarboxylase [Phycisphaerae bacterium RAS1]